MAYVRPDGGMAGVEPYVYDPTLSGGSDSFDSYGYSYGYGDGLAGLFGKKGFFSRVGKGIGRVAGKVAKVGVKIAPYAVGGIVGGTLIKKGAKALKKKKRRSPSGVVAQVASNFPSPPNTVAPGTMVAQDIVPTQQAPGSFNGGSTGFGPGQSGGGPTMDAAGDEAGGAAMEAGVMGGGLDSKALLIGAVVLGAVVLMNKRR